MATPRRPWESDFSSEYHAMLACTRLITWLGLSSIEYGIARADYDRLCVWLDLINARGLIIRNTILSIYRARSSGNSRPDWMVKALEMGHYYAEEIISSAQAARQRLDEDNWQHAGNETARCLAGALIIEGYLLAGPAPLGDEAEAVREAQEIVAALDR